MRTARVRRQHCPRYSRYTPLCACLADDRAISLEGEVLRLSSMLRDVTASLTKLRESQSADQVLPTRAIACRLKCFAAAQAALEVRTATVARLEAALSDSEAQCLAGVSYSVHVARPRLVHSHEFLQPACWPSTRRLDMSRLCKCVAKFSGS